MAEIPYHPDHRHSHNCRRSAGICDVLFLLYRVCRAAGSDALRAARACNRAFRIAADECTTALRLYMNDTRTLALPKCAPSATTVAIIDCEHLTDISALAMCASMRALKLSCCSELMDISAVGLCTNLRALQVAHCGSIVDISAVGLCTNLESLKLQDCVGIVDVSAIGLCGSLQELDILWCNRLLDTSPIGSCTSLQTLKLVLHNVGDISFIESCVRLNVFNIKRIPCNTHLMDAVDLSPLSSCTNLEVLKIASINLADISPLASCTKLQKLTIAWSESLVDVSSLAYCTNLQKLHLVLKHLGDMSAVGCLRSLRSLKLSQACVTDISCMEDITTLTSVELIDTGNISSVAALGASKNITDLNLCSTLVTGLDGFNASSLRRLELYSPISPPCMSPFLRGSRNLEVLHISDCAALSFSEVATLPRLRWLCVDAVDSGMDLSPLARCSSLEALEMHYVTLESLRPLQSCASLWRLVCYSTRICDDDAFDALSTLLTLQDINVGGTDIKGVSMFAECKRLRNLKICDTAIHDLTPLARCTLLEDLNVSDTVVSDLSPLRSCKLLRSIYCMNTNVTAEHVREFLEGREGEINIDCSRNDEATLYDEHHAGWGDGIFYPGPS
jgi:Leucine-rich repeat (LRR) protein